jgi:chromatin remodeling complex protein RSC6
MATLESLQADLAAVAKDLKGLNKLVRKIRAHQEDPNGEKAKVRAENNGFNRPLEISPALREFLDLDPEETISRSNVTRRINKYVTENGLKHPDNGRVIILDDKLTKLLSPPAGLEITFLNVQKYLSPHYTKLPVSETKAAAAAADGEPSSEKRPVSAGPKRPTVRKAATAKA